MTVSSGTLKTRNIDFASLFCTRFQQYHANKALRYLVRSLTVFFSSVLCDCSASEKLLAKINY